MVTARVSSLSQPSRTLLKRRLEPSTVGVTHLLGAAAILTLFVDGMWPLSAAVHVALAATFVLTVCLTALALVRSINGNQLGLAYWRAGPWYLMWGSLAYGITSYTWMTPQTGASASILQSSTADALVVFGVAMIVWTIGYVAGPRKPVISLGHKLLRVSYGKTGAILKTGRALPWLLYGAGTTARIVAALLNGHIGYIGDTTAATEKANNYTQVLSSASSLATFAIAVAAWRIFVDRPASGRLTLVLLLMAELAVGAALGMKENFVVAGLAVLVPYGVGKGKLPVRAIAGMGFTFLLLVIPFNAAYREAVRGSGASMSTEEALEIVPATFEEIASPTSWSETLSESYDMFMFRVRMIDNIAMIVQKAPDVIPYDSAVEYAQAPLVGLIPRSVWPDKPIMTSGYEFSQKYYDRPSYVYTSSAITNVGDLYMHGGWGTVLVGAFVLGSGFRLLDVLARPDEDVRALFLLLALLPTLVKSEEDISGLLVGIPAFVFTAALGVRLACVKRS
jgi:hypothetical protein